MKLHDPNHRSIHHGFLERIIGKDQFEVLKGIVKKGECSASQAPEVGESDDYGVNGRVKRENEIGKHKWDGKVVPVLCIVDAFLAHGVVPPVSVRVHRSLQEKRISILAMLFCRRIQVQAGQPAPGSQHSLNRR
jgi:hypothetical protein